MTVVERQTHLSRTPAPILVVGAVVSVQVGAALATHVISDVGPAGATVLRLRLRRHRPCASSGDRDVPRSALPLLALYGLTLGVMNLLFYEALARAPLGVVVTVEFLGPLGVAVAGSRRPRDGAVVALAAIGIVLLARGGGGAVDVVGIVLAALAGACWAAYILVSAAVGRRHPGTAPLAVAMMLAALVTLPFGAGAGHARRCAFAAARRRESGSCRACCRTRWSSRRCDVCRLGSSAS